MTDASPQIFIEPAQQCDIEEIVTIDRAAATLFLPTGLLSDDAFDGHIPYDVLSQAADLSCLDVARLQSGRTVGFTLVSERGHSLYLDQVSVHPDEGRQGIGRRLVGNIVRKAAARYLDSVTLSTFRDLPWNAPFYASMGFREIARKDLVPFMVEVERQQAPYMDISKRVFMIKRVRKPWFRARRSA